MSIIKTNGEIVAQLEETNASINLLQQELGDHILKNYKDAMAAGFRYAQFDEFSYRWSQFFADRYPAVLRSGGDYDTAVEYLQECHAWRKEAVAKGALPQSKATDPYTEPPKDPAGVMPLVQGAMILGGLYLAVQLVSGIRGK